MYEYADEVIKYLNKRNMKLFDNYKATVLKADEINKLNATTELYETLDRETRALFKEIAKRAYYDERHTLLDGLDYFILEYLSQPDKVTKYIYDNEVERKKGYLYESVLTAIGNTETEKAVEKALRLWTLMIEQYAIDITDTARIKAFQDMGIRYVKWLTENDEKVCDECVPRHGMVYPIDKIPDKHWNCRCYVIPVM